MVTKDAPNQAFKSWRTIGWLVLRSEHPLFEVETLSASIFPTCLFKHDILYSDTLPRQLLQRRHDFDDERQERGTFGKTSERSCLSISVLPNFCFGIALSIRWSNITRVSQSSSSLYGAVFVTPNT